MHAADFIRSLEYQAFLIRVALRGEGPRVAKKTGPNTHE
jgi:hypothetical protein